MAVGLVLSVEATEFTWTGGSGNWLTPANWTPSGFENTSGHSCTVATGTAQADGTTFYPQLTIAGTDGVGGTLQLSTNTTISGGLRLAGGRVYFRNVNVGDITLSGNIEAVADTSSRIEPYGRIAYGNDGLGGTITHVNGSLTGSGTIRIGGTETWPKSFILDGDSSGFNGKLEIDRGGLSLRMNGTFSMGDNARIYVNSGGSAGLLGLNGTWTIKGGIFLNGGTVTYRAWNASAGTTWSRETPWTILSNSVITSYSASGADIAGPLHGTANLTISHDRRDGYDSATINLRGTNSTFSGTIIVKARSVDEGKTTLYLGHSGALPSASPRATLIIEESGGVKGRVTIGAYKPNGSGGTVVDVPNVHIKVKRLIVGGINIPPGTYSQANPVPVSGYVFFNNATSTLEVKPGGGTVIFFK
jgi:hypothetical protein